MSRWPVSLLTDAAEKLDRRYGWDKLPWPLGLATLIGLRNRLREMRTLLLRHFPELAGVANHFAPWQRAGVREAS